MGRFDDRATRPARGPGDMLKWRIWDTLAGRRARDGAPFQTPTRASDLELLRSTSPSLTWIGHATFLLRLGGTLIATDPVYCERISGVVPRRAPPGLALAEAPPIDVVAVTHNHRDHLDLPTLKQIGPQPLYVTPLGNGALLRAAGLPNVVELDWWESCRSPSGTVEITLVPSRHWSMRQPWDRNQMLWGGFVFRSTDGVGYHAGDTAAFDGFAEIGRRMGPIDWALLPIGAYEPRWFMEPQHMNPDEAGQAFLDLGARTLVAMHWGTFKLTDEPLGEPPEKLRAFFDAHKELDPARLWIFDVGETRPLAK